MSEENETEADRLDHSIEYLENKLETIKQIKSLVKELEEIGDVVVNNPKDSRHIEIYAETDEPVSELIELSQLEVTVSDNIIYNPEDETFKIKKNFRIDK